MKNNKLTIKEFINILVPMFSIVPSYVDFKNKEVGVELLSNIGYKIREYMQIYDDTLDEFKNMIDKEKYFKHYDIWINEFNRYLNDYINKIPNNRKSFDFEYGSLIIKYKKKDLDFLQNLDLNVYTEMRNLCYWVMTTERHRRYLSELSDNEADIIIQKEKELILKK